MGLLENAITKITGKNHAMSFKIKETADLMQSAGLGGLADIFADYLAIIGKNELQPLRKAAVIACGDHGVCEMKVSAYPQKATVDMVRNYLVSRGAVANAMTNFARADMFVVDAGIAADVDELPGLIRKKIAYGTKNFTSGPAMTRENALRAVEAGIKLADELTAKKYNCFLLGEMGIANTTSSAAVAAAVCGLTPQEATGRGTNISDDRLKIKIAAVKKALAINKPNPCDGLDLLSKVGGYEFGFLAGVILGAASDNAFIILDGFNTAAAALIAQAFCPASTKYLLPSHLAGEPAHRAALLKLGLKPYINLQLQLSETAGSSVIARLIELSSKLYILLKRDKLSVKRISPKELSLPNYYLDKNYLDKCEERIDNLTKPIHSLGRLENIAVFLAGILRKIQPSMRDVKENKALLLPYIYKSSQCLKISVTNKYASEQVGLILIDAALHMLGDMKTFAEAAVAVANDGPGAGRQKEH